MNLDLQIFAPIDFGQSYVTDQGKKELKQYLGGLGWKPTKFQPLDLDEHFFGQHTSVYRDLTDPLLKGHGPEAISANSEANPVCAELWVQSTGECILACTYRLTERSGAQINVRVARNAYYLLCRPETAHFRRVYKAAVDFLWSHLGRLPGGAADMLTRDKSDATRPHWFHGIYLHVAAGNAANLMANDDLKMLAGNSEQCRSYAGVTVSGPPMPVPAGSGSVPTVMDMEVKACFGYETTAISSTDEDEVQSVARLVKLIGYVWELHYMVDVRAAYRIQQVQERTESTSLRDVRIFRQQTAALLGACEEAHLSVTDRFVHMVRSVVAEWHLDDMKEAIQTHCELLDQMYKGLEDERTDYRNRQVTGVLVFLALVTVISVTTDAINFFNGPASKTAAEWGSIFAAVQWPQALLALLGPFCIFALGTGMLWVWGKCHRPSA